MLSAYSNKREYILSLPTFLNESAAPIPATNVGNVPNLLISTSTISMSFPPASIKPFKKSDWRKSFDSSSNFAFTKSIEAWIDLEYSSFSLRAEPSASVASL